MWQKKNWVIVNKTKLREPNFGACIALSNLDLSKYNKLVVIEFFLQNLQFINLCICFLFTENSDTICALPIVNALNL